MGSKRTVGRDGVPDRALEADLAAQDGRHHRERRLRLARFPKRERAAQQLVQQHAQRPLRPRQAICVSSIPRYRAPPTLHPQAQDSGISFAHAAVVRHTCNPLTVKPCSFKCFNTQMTGIKCLDSSTHHLCADCTITQNAACMSPMCTLYNREPHARAPCRTPRHSSA